MTCEICDTQTATMWVEKPVTETVLLSLGTQPLVSTVTPIPSCDDCGPQLGYKILAPLTANIRSRD